MKESNLEKNSSTGTTNEKRIKVRNDRRPMFRNLKTKKNKNVSKYSFFAFIVTAIKKLFLSVIMNKIPDKTNVNISFENKIQRGVWNSAIDLHQNNRTIIKHMASKENVPANRRHINTEDQMQARSYNHEFCRKFFSEVPIQEAYYLTIKLMTSDPSPNELCDRFGMFCCMEEHGLDCERKWEEVCRYLKYDFLRDLGVVVSENNTNVVEENLRNIRNESNSELMDDFRASEETNIDWILNRANSIDISEDINVEFD